MQSIKDQEVKLIGITREDIQDIFEKTLKEFKESKTRIIYLDASYLYNFELDDFQYIRKLNMLMRRNPLHVREWHRMLERWYNDQTVRQDNGYNIKPIQIERTFDRIVNEGMEELAKAIMGKSDMLFEFRAVGKGETTEALPSDTQLVDQVDRINVNQTKEGGSLSRDGTTIYSIGNHAKTIPTADITECGIFSGAAAPDDKMLDHSIFQTAVVHVQDADAVGSTTIIYMCGA